MPPKVKSKNTTKDKVNAKQKTPTKNKKKESLDKDKTPKKSNTNDKDLSKKYQKKTQIEHIRDRGDTYIGSAEECEVVDYNVKVINGEDKIVLVKYKYNPGLSNIIEEILVNAIDSYSRQSKNWDKASRVTEIKINIYEKTGMISIMNNGAGIDVAKHPEYKIYIPQMIFGELLTSGNYDDEEEKVTGGKNGYGAKLTNIYSTYFEVETVDKTRKLKYKQIFRDSLNIKEEPEIVPYKSKPFTKISFIPNYEKFGLKKLNPEMISLMKKRAYDTIATTNGDVKVYFNDELLSIKNFKEYMNLYFISPESSADEDTKEETSKEDVFGQDFVFSNVNERWTVGACLTPTFGFKQVSFVNGINTSRGGRHVDYIVKQITDHLVNTIFKKKKIVVKANTIKDNIMVFVKSTIVNPSFDSQTKEILTTNKSKFGSECVLPTKFMDKLGDLGVISNTLSLNKYQNTLLMKRTDGTKKSAIRDIEKLDDAKYAGTKRSDKCTLILTEGDSAKAMAIAGLSVIDNGRDYFGVYPLTGKIINGRGENKEKQMYANKVIINIKRIIGLQENKNYENNINSLRYSKILIMTDQDVDGTHIKGLLINYFSRWPSLMKTDNFITCLLTPIVKVKVRGSSIHKNFYNISDFKQWSENNKDNKWSAKYYKGLGTSTPNEAKEYFREFKQLIYFWQDEDDLSSDSLDMAFNPKRADDRKLWLRGYDSNRVVNVNDGQVSISKFVDNDLIHFSNYDNQRSIPSICDGLKPSQRKILYCSQNIKLTKEIRVSQLAGKVSECMLYHHGEVSLTGTIVGMAQSYVGSNNINLLVPNGQFGTRINGGKDSAQPRYIHTYLSPITSLLYNKKDFPIYDYVEDDGTKVEPYYYVPILPMVLINGAIGIGTGWSVGIPKFKPEDIIRNIKALMNDEKQPDLNPWFRGHRGKITKIDNNSWISRGIYRHTGVDTIEVTELPINMWTDTYKSHLDALAIGKDIYYKCPIRKEKIPYIKDYRNYSSESKVHFIIKLNTDILDNLLDSYHNKYITEFEYIFKLTTKMTSSNKMNLYNADLRLTNYTSAEEILEEFYNIRLKFYKKRKNYMLQEMRKQLELISVKVKFILDIINKNIIVNNKTKKNINSQLEKGKYPKMCNGILYPLTKENKEILKEGDYDFLIKMPIYNLTKERIDELTKELNKIKDDLDILLSKTEKDLWLEDIKLFEADYKGFMKDYYKYMDYDPEDFKPSYKRKRKLIIRDRNALQ